MAGAEEAAAGEVAEGAQPDPASILELGAGEALASLKRRVVEAVHPTSEEAATAAVMPLR